VLIAAAAGLALLASVRRSATGDEFGTIMIAAQSDPALIMEKVQQTDIHPPTPYLLLHYWGRLAGYGDLAMRLPSLVFILLALPALWALIRRWAPDLSAADARWVLTVAASAPVLWVQAVFARYYALGTLAGLVSVLSYFRWLERPSAARTALYVLLTALTFYIHFFLAALLVGSQWLHYGLRDLGRPRRIRPGWFVAQALIAGLALPIVLRSILPLLTGANTSLANRADEGVAGCKALPLYLAGQSYTALTGGVPFPWDFWITIPLAATVAGLLIRDFRRERVWLAPPAIALVVIPAFLLALVIGLLVPVTGYFAGTLRAGHVAVLGWMLLGLCAVRIRHPAPRRLALAVLLLANGGLLAWAGGDGFSMFQSTPLKQAAAWIRADTPAGATGIVFHPYVHSWGDPLERYAPGVATRFAFDGQTAANAAANAALARTGGFSRVWIIQRNRFNRQAQALADELAGAHYQETGALHLQIQRGYDIWFKERIKTARGLGFATNPSARSYWTIRRFERSPASP